MSIFPQKEKIATRKGWIVLDGNKGYVKWLIVSMACSHFGIAVCHTGLKKRLAA